MRLTPERDFFNAELVRQKLGLHVQELTRELAANMGFPFFGGFVGPASQVKKSRCAIAAPSRSTETMPSR